MTGSFKYAFFDFDGTVCDTEGQYTLFWGEIGRKYLPEVPGFEHIIKGTTLKQVFERYFPDKKLQKTIEEALDEFEGNMNYKLFPGVEEFIANIKSQGVKCAIVTSSNLIKMASARKSIPEFFALFDRVFTAEDFTASKPAPDCYLYAALTFNANLKDCVVFEDAYNGLEAGMASGIFTVGIASGHSPEELENKCDYIITDYSTIDYNTIAKALTR